MKYKLPCNIARWSNNLLKTASPDLSAPNPASSLDMLQYVLMSHVTRL